MQCSRDLILYRFIVYCFSKCLFFAPRDNTHAHYIIVAPQMANFSLALCVCLLFHYCFLFFPQAKHMLFVALQYPTTKHYTCSLTPPPPPPYRQYPAYILTLYSLRVSFLWYNPPFQYLVRLSLFALRLANFSQDAAAFSFTKSSFPPLIAETAAKDQFCTLK